MKRGNPDTALEPPGLADPELFRSVFVDTGERLLTVILDASEASQAILLREAIKNLEREGVRAVWLVFGGNEADDTPSDLGDVTPAVIHSFPGLDHPLRSAAQAISDAVICLGSGGDSFPHNPSSQGPAWTILPSESLGAPSGKGDRILALKKGNAESLASAIRTAIYGGSGSRSENRASAESQLPERSAPPAETGHAARSSSSTEFVLFNEWGMGDELLLSAVGREILRENPELKVWIRSRYRFRFSTIRNADRVVVIDNGRVVEEGVSSRIELTQAKFEWMPWAGGR